MENYVSKKAIITGDEIRSSLGTALCKRLVRSGWDVARIIKEGKPGDDFDPLKKTSKGGKIETYVYNESKFENTVNAKNIENLFSQAVSTLGHIDLFLYLGTASEKINHSLKSHEQLKDDSEISISRTDDIEKNTPLHNDDEENESLHHNKETQTHNNKEVAENSVIHKEIQDNNSQLNQTIKEIHEFIAWMKEASAYFEDQEDGHIAGIYSVFGTWLSNKSAMYAGSQSFQSQYLSSLSHQLSEKEINVSSIYYGNIKNTSQNTGDLEEALNMFAISPEKAARLILKAVFTKKKKIYIPGYWMFISPIYKAVLQPLLRRLGL